MLDPTKPVFMVDPLQKYSRSQRQDIIDTCGIIPYWLQSVKDDFKQCIKDNYPWLGEPMGGEVIEGVYVYPEDPELFPYMQAIFGDQVAYIYPYGIVAVIDRDTNVQWIVRCD